MGLSRQDLDNWDVLLASGIHWVSMEKVLRSSQKPPEHSGPPTFASHRGKAEAPIESVTTEISPENRPVSLKTPVFLCKNPMGKVRPGDEPTRRPA